MFDMRAGNILNDNNNNQTAREILLNPRTQFTSLTSNRRRLRFELNSMHFVCLKHCLPQPPPTRHQFLPYPPLDSERVSKCVRVEELI